jgi:hypothetical protein
MVGRRPDSETKNKNVARSIPIGRKPARGAMIVPKAWRCSRQPTRSGTWRPKRSRRPDTRQWGTAPETILGLDADAHQQKLFLDPVLPHWLPEITLYKLRVGKG